MRFAPVIQVPGASSFISANMPVPAGMPMKDMPTNYELPGGASTDASLEGVLPSS